MYTNTVKDNWSSLSSSFLNATSSLEIIKAKLECIKAVNQEGLSIDEVKSICGDYYEELKDIIFSDDKQKNDEEQTKLNDQINDITKEIADIQKKYDAYGQTITNYNTVVNLINNFQEELSVTFSRSEADSIITKYCYVLKTNGTGQICSLDKKTSEKIIYTTYSESQAKSVGEEILNFISYMDAQVKKYQDIIVAYKLLIKSKF